MGYFEAVETRARLIEILAEFIDIDVPGILLNFNFHHAITREGLPPPFLTTIASGAISN
jgi:hypothetical protein